MSEFLSQHIQDSFVHLSITSDKFLAVARKSVKAEYFGSSITEEIVRVCYQYYDLLKHAPGDHLHDEILRKIKDKPAEEKKLYVDYLKKLTTMKPPDELYVIKRMNSFIKAREFESGAVEFVKLVEKGDFQSAEKLMFKTLRSGIEKEEIGLVYFDSMTPSYYGKEREEFLMKVGIEELDKWMEFTRGQFMCILGPYKGKKSWFCCFIGKQGIINGLKVLHVTHEMSAKAVEMRYDRMLGGLLKKRTPEVVTYTERNKKGEIINTTKKEAATIYDLKKVQSVRKKAKRFGGELIIKKYPMGTCTIDEIDRYMNYLEVFHEFVPDILINDYPEIMDLPLAKSAAMRDRINEAYINHKRWADERNILVVAPSQVTRAALEKPTLSRGDFAEDIRKLGNVDLVIAICQGKILEKEGLLKLWVFGVREGMEGFGCIISQNLDVGQFVTNSWDIKKEE